MGSDFFEELSWNFLLFKHWLSDPGCDCEIGVEEVELEKLVDKSTKSESCWWRAAAETISSRGNVQIFLILLLKFKFL